MAMVNVEEARIAKEMNELVKNKLKVAKVDVQVMDKDGKLPKKVEDAIKHRIRLIRADFSNIKKSIPTSDPLYEKILYSILATSYAFSCYEAYRNVFKEFHIRARRMLMTRTRR